MSTALEASALARLEKLINSTLALDPGSAAQLAQLAGRAMALHSTFPPCRLHVRFLPGGAVALTPSPVGEPEVSLTGSPVALAALFANASRQVSFAGSGVTLAGNQELLQRLSAILAQLDIDWEQALAGVIGDTAAHLAGRIVRQGLKWQSSAAGRAASGVGEYLREESGLALGRVEAEPWLRAVRDLSLDADRLAARIDRLRLGMATAGH